MITNLYEYTNPAFTYTDSYIRNQFVIIKRKLCI